LKVVFVVSGNKGKDAPFVTEQIESTPDIEPVMYRIKGSGMSGYLKNMVSLHAFVRKEKPAIIHAHFGLSGLLIGLLPIATPKVVTFHGSDVNNAKNRKFSRLAYRLCSHSVFVHEQLRKKLDVHEHCSVIPCGVDTELFKPMDSAALREKYNFEKGKSYVLFSSAFNNKVKNATLAFEVIDLIKKKTQVELIELAGRSREEVAELMNACDACLMTSFSEGSPQFIKEALACNSPIVSTNVGDVEERLNGVEGCFVTSFEPREVAESLQHALKVGKTQGRQRAYEVGKTVIGQKIRKIYLTLRPENGKVE